ncbi:hypothetical protein ACFL0I_05130, partial [Gemmatimonadota bacterium]
MRTTLRSRFTLAALTTLFLLPLLSPLQAQIPADRSLVPESIRTPILLEYSGELAYTHVSILALNRQRTLEEYAETYMETDYMEEMATRYGLSEVQVDYFETGDAWVPEVGDLWMVEPYQKRIASLTEVPAALASGSMSTDVETELVYVGSGRPADYQGKDLVGKIAMGNTSVGSVFGTAVGHMKELPGAGIGT